MAEHADVAIIGMSGVFPDALDLRAFEQNLRSGHDAVRPPSEERLRYSSVDPSHEYAPLGSLDRIDLFDYRFFGLSLKEAEYMDPHQRISLQLACAAIENAGYRHSELSGTRTGVFLSAPRPEYQELLREPDALELLGNAPSALAGRISYFLDLRGASMVVDAGCCGSLVAVDRACRELASGDGKYALAGGVGLRVLLDAQTAMAPFAEIISPEGKCKAFDARADGAAPGEGGAILLLKLLDQAVEDGDRIRAVIRGSAVNQNGNRATGLSAPSPAAQTEVIVEAWDNAGIDPATIGYVEAHGSGTKLGDVIEIEGLSQAFARRGIRDGSCAIGSVKTNVGHLDHAAGIAGLVKAVLAVENKTLYPSLHFESPNPLAGLESAPVYVQTETSEWRGGDGPRRAGVSSFSLAGTNVHMIVEEPPDIPIAQPNGLGAYLATVSARSNAALSAYCRELAEAVATSNATVPAITQVMNRGRDDYEVRAATIVRDREELVGWLRSNPSSAQPSRSARSLAILFSGDDQIDGDVLDGIGRSFAAITDAREEFAKWMQGLARTDTSRLAASQFALHRLVRALGLRESAVLGAGVGNAVVRAIRGDVDPYHALAGIADTAPTAGFDDDRFRSALDDLTAAGTVFLAVGRDGALTRRARELGYQVHELLNGSGADGPLRVLAELYRAGLDVDWDRHYEGVPVARLDLPTYPFEAERCWCLPLEEVHGRPSEGRRDELVEIAPMIGGDEFGSDDERVMAAIWAQALKIEPSGPETDYFDLGGTSIIGMVVLDLVEQHFGVRIGFQDLYEHSTVALLAARVRALVEEEESSAPEAPIAPVARGDYLPVSRGQEQIWFIDQLNPGRPLYNIPFDLHIRGELDADALRTAIGALMARHEILRMSFRSVEGEARGVVDVPPRCDLPIMDLSALPAHARSSEVRRLWDVEATTPFVLSQGPLFRSTLLRLGEREHVLLMTMHHIVYDGWTPQIIQGELADLYDASIEGREPELPPLPIQYVDFAAWQREWVTGEACARELDYWVKHLTDAPVLDLPTDRARPPVQSHRGDMITFELDESLVDSLRDLSRSQSVTLFTTMLAAVDVLMFRHSGQTDVVIGTPTSGRKRAETRGLIGYFNNMLAVRADLSGDPTFRELIHGVRDVVVGALDHDQVPFEQVVDALRPKRDLSRNPLFQVAYSHQNAPQGEYHLGSLEIDYFGEGSVRGIAPGTSKFDLTIGVGDGGVGGAEAYVEYATDLFDAETVEAMVRRFVRLLESIARDPDTRISQLELLGEEERAAAALLGPAMQGGDGLPVHRQFERRAAETPDFPAVSDAETTLTYTELDAAANRLSRRLIEIGVERDGIVALVLPRGVEFATAALAALKAGAAYLPLDPAYPPARIEYMLADSGARVAVMSGDVGGLSIPEEVRIVDLRAEIAAVDAGSFAPPERAVDGRNAAYLIYTSGSTGTPKAVVVEHAALSNLCSWHVAEYGITPADRASQFASPAFDASVWELWPYLTAGAAVEFPPEMAPFDPGAFVRWIDRRGISVAFLPTPLAEALFVSADRPRGLRVFFTGGDRLTHVPEDPAPLLVNLYGPSEAAVVATACEVPPGTPAPPPIGRPISGVRCYVLDAGLDPTPRGAPGELYVAGAGLARGYLGRSGLTAERFLPDPFTGVPGERMYATGDLVRVARDGNLEFLERLDDQIKIRGLRVESGEIEVALESHPAVRVAAVAVDRRGRLARLVGYVVPDGTPPTSDELRAHLRTRLPENMVPAVYVVLDALPQTPNGKIDRAALEPPRHERLDPVAGAERPATPAEQALAEIWADLLGIDEVGIHDNFFELGGDSILSIQIVARAERAGVPLAPGDVFERQTIAELAAGVAEHPTTTAAPRAIEGPVETTPIQKWFFDLRLPNRNHFNQSIMLTARERLDVDALRAALGYVTSHHDVLRLRFESDGSGWKARLGPLNDSVFVLDRVELETLDTAERNLVVDREIARSQRALDIESGPMMAALLLDSGGSEPQSLFLTVHHLSIDAVSWGILLDDLEEAYSLARSGRAIALPRKTSSFAEWSDRLVSYARTANVETETAHWRALAAVAPPRIPRDRDGENLVSSVERLVVGLDEEETTRVAGPARRGGGARPQEMLLAALAEAISEWTSERFVRVDVEGHGREQLFDDIELSRTVGWFTSLFPVAFEVTGNPASDLRAVGDALGAIPRNGVTFGIFRYLAADPTLRDDLSRAGAEISFNYLGRFDGKSRGGLFVPADHEVGDVHDPGGRRGWLLEIEAAVENGRLEVNFSYSRNVHERATIESLAGGFVAALRRLSSEPGSATAPSRSLPTSLDRDTFDRLLQDAGDAEDAYPLTPMQQGLLLHSQVERDRHLYVEQLRFMLEGPLDHDAFESAWQMVVARHDSLRTSVASDGVPVPVAVVHRRVRLPYERHDWSPLTGGGPDEGSADVRLSEFLTEDARRGIDVTSPPLMRVSVLDVSETEHVVVWTHHHLALDGWSVQVVLGEVFECYEALQKGRTPELGPAGSFREFVSWLAERDAGAHRAFWRNALKGFTPSRIRLGEGGSDRGYEMVSKTLSEGSRETIGRMARARRVTMNALVQAAWARLIAAYSFSDDVVFGITMSGRSAPIQDVESTVGLLLNTVPVRIRVPRSGTIEDWLHAVQSAQGHLIGFEHTPLAEIQAASDVGSGIPLFETILAFENYPVDRLWDEDSDLGIKALPYVEQTNYAISVVVAPAPEMSIRISYDGNRFDRSEIGTLLDRFAFLLEEMAAAPEKRPWDVQIEPVGESAPLESGEQTAPGFAPDAIRQHAARIPSAIALRSVDREISYGELAEGTKIIADRLLAAGVRRGDIVAVACEDRVDEITAALGVVEAGAAYLAVGPDEEDAVDLVRRSSCAVVVASAGIAPRLGRVGLPVIVPSDHVPPAFGGRTEVGARDLFCVLATGGSSGRAELVGIEHGAVQVTTSHAAMHIQPGTVVASTGALLYGRHLIDALAPLAKGATVALVDGSLGFPEDATFVHDVPGAVTEAALLGALPAGTRVVSLWGERPRDDTIASLRAAAPETIVVNNYGPTEAAVVSTACEVLPGTSAPSRIGRPIPGVRCYVLDPGLGRVPAEVPGELYVAGSSLARGYLGRPDLTAERFLPDPFAETPGQRMYATGDLVRISRDGNLEFLGRRGDEIDVNGLRVEPGEIEVAIEAHPAVREAAIAAHRGGGSTRLVAYVVPHGGAPGTTELIDHLERRLPSYMIPGTYVSLEALPRRPSGKLDRSALASEDRHRAAIPDAERPPTPTEQILAGIWSDILGIEEIGVHDNFFDLGGHSLVATRVVSQVRAIFDADVPVRHLFDARDLGDFARRVVEIVGGGDIADQIALAVAEVEALPEDEIRARLLDYASVEEEAPR